MSDRHSHLPPQAYKKGDRVVGVDGEIRLHGTVAAISSPKWIEDGDVLIAWDGQDYEPGAKGHLVPVELLRLCPERLHRSRCLQFFTGEALDGVSPVARNEGEADEVFRIRAVQVWYGLYVSEGVGS